MSAVTRRGALALGAAVLAGCEAPPAPVAGGFAGASPERGHLLRPATGGAPARDWPAPAVTRRVHTVIAGGGVAGLAAARALRLHGLDDFALLELEDQPGGNSRGMAVGGIACPMGAHYLPVPGDDAPEVQDLLEELGLRQRVAGRWQYDDRHLCHSPQERLFFEGQWHEGLLPVQGVGAATLAQYRAFAQRVEAARRAAHYAMPSARGELAPAQQALDALTFADWLQAQGLTDAHLRWYLDYCCRDDYGASAATVSAWAGIHYFASRHGFHAPGDAEADRDAVLTWPQGNGWLTQRLAAPLGERLHTGRLVLRIQAQRAGVTVDSWDARAQQVERWQARRCVVALPVFVAARVVADAPAPLREAAARLRYAPWLVANLHIREALHDRPGAAPSWDNVLYGAQGLGYVDAMHQSLWPVPGATVLSYYRALGDGVLGDAPAARRQLLEQPWSHWRDAVLAELSLPHPDLAGKLTRMEICRWGHAMAMPVPGLASRLGPLRAALAADPGPLRFAHADWAGYSVFEEAFTLGHLAGLAGLPVRRSRSPAALNRASRLRSRQP